MPESPAIAAEPTGRFLDTASWARASTFEFFRHYEQPFTNICARVDVTRTLDHCRRTGASFFLASWFCAMRVANELESFRLRLRGERVWSHDQLFLGTTVLRPDDTFGFCYIPYARHFEAFQRLGRLAVDATRARDEPLDRYADRDDCIFGSTLPWIRFTGLAHAHRHPPRDSVPRIVFGKYAPEGESVSMPVSVEVHHALCDGLHVARFFERLEARLGEPRSSL